MITFTPLGETSGRLGNQLWQIASSVGIARKLGQSVGFPDWDYRPFFSVPDEFFPEQLIHPNTTQAHETGLVSHIDLRARVYLQDYNLWRHIEPQIREWFTPSKHAYSYIEENCPAFVDDWAGPKLAVHVRRGDNAAQPSNNHPLRPWSYYEDAIMSFTSMSPDESHLVIFSDDIEWCRGRFDHFPTALGFRDTETHYFVGGNPRKKEHERGYKTDPFNDWVDLIAMSMCDSFVISNSTYSWWAAFLGRKPHQQPPVYPWPWFGTDLQYLDASLMFPEDWRRLDHGQQHV